MANSSVIVIEQRMIRSKVWLSLSKTALLVYLLFRCKCQIAKKCRRSTKRSEGLMERILNNGEIVFTYAEAKRLYGITAPRFVRALDELITKGFINIAATGMGVHKMTSLYAISERWQFFGTSDFQTAKRPKTLIANSGFKKKSSNVFVSGAAHKNVSGEVLAAHKNVSGGKVKNPYKRIGDK